MSWSRGTLSNPIKNWYKVCSDSINKIPDSNCANKENRLVQPCNKMDKLIKAIIVIINLAKQANASVLFMAVIIENPPKANKARYSLEREFEKTVLLAKE